MGSAKTHVYFNLHRSVWSLMLRGRVTGHAANVVVRNARFVVREGGRQRVLREGRKNVHAFVVGDVQVNGWPGAPLLDAGWVRVTYNPFAAASFTIKATGEAIVGADEVVMGADRSVWAYGVRLAA